jgi:PAS domain S-box-containing protein
MGVGLPLSGRRQDGSEFPLEASLGPLDEGSESLVIVSIRDITERQQAQAAAEAANQDLRALQALTDTALSLLSLDDLLPALLERVMEALQVDNAVALLLDGAGQTLTIQAVRGVEEPVAAQVRVPLGQGFAGRIAASREPLVVDDVSSFPVVNPFLREQLHSVVGVPLLVRDKLLGVAHVGTIKPRQFTARDVQLLQKAADRMALAIDRARLYQAERRAHEMAEAALAQAQVSEYRYRCLVESNIIGIVVSDTERVIEANDAYLQLTGYTRADLEAGKLDRARLTTADPSKAAERGAQEALTTGTSSTFEREYLRPDGSRASALVGSALLQRDPPLFVSFLLDRSEQKRLKRALAERVAQLEAIMEAVPDALTVYDTSGHIVLANSAHHEQVARFNLPTPPGETVSQRYQQIGGAYNAQGVKLDETAWPQARALSGEVLTSANAAELSVRTPHGELATFSVTGAPLRDGSGHITGAVTVSRDVTEQKQLERRFAEQAEQLDRTFEHITDGLVVYNAAGQPVRINSAARRILGLDAAPSNYVQLPASDRATLYQAYDEQGPLENPDNWPLMRMLSGQGPEVYTREVRLRTFDGREVELLSSLTPLRDQEAHVVGAVSIMHDQTEQKRLGREREEARAHELALEDTARHMEEFLAIASHDLRTPLTVVKTRLQMALRRLTRQRDEAAVPLDALLETLSETDLEALSANLLAANQSADKLTRLVSLLLDVSQARSGALELQLAPRDLAALVREQVAAQQMVARDRTIKLAVPDAAVVWVLADADRLTQVLDNYLNNALKYSPADQPVSVRLEVMENQAVVSVADHGPGLPAEEQSRIWDWFHRAPGIEAQYVSGDSAGSLGLGLHICKQLVESHPGGGVGVESVVGKGSTFWFRLPLTS